MFESSTAQFNLRPLASPVVALLPRKRNPAIENALLAVRGLVVAYEDQKSGERTLAVDGVDLSIGEGEFVSIVGLSGCGKSSFLNAITGLIAPAAGEIRVAGERVTGPGPDRAVVFNEAEAPRPH